MVRHSPHLMIQDRRIAVGIPWRTRTMAYPLESWRAYGWVRTRSQPYDGGRLVASCC